MAEEGRLIDPEERDKRRRNGRKRSFPEGKLIDPAERDAKPRRRSGKRRVVPLDRLGRPRRDDQVPEKRLKEKKVPIVRDPVTGRALLDQRVHEERRRLRRKEREYERAQSARAVVLTLGLRTAKHWTNLASRYWRQMALLRLTLAELEDALADLRDDPRGQHDYVMSLRAKHHACNAAQGIATTHQERSAVAMREKYRRDSERLAAADVPVNPPEPAPIGRAQALRTYASLLGELVTRRTELLDERSTYEPNSPELRAAQQELKQVEDDLEALGAPVEHRQGGSQRRGRPRGAGVARQRSKRSD